MAYKLKDARLINRNGFWYFVRRIPRHLARLDGRGPVVWSTGIAVYDEPRAIRAKIIVRQHVHKLRQRVATNREATIAPWPESPTGRRRRPLVVIALRKPAIVDVRHGS